MATPRSGCLFANCNDSVVTDIYITRISGNTHSSWIHGDTNSVSTCNTALNQNATALKVALRTTEKERALNSLNDSIIRGRVWVEVLKKLFSSSKVGRYTYFEHVKIQS